MTGIYIPYYGVGPDLSFLDQKIELGRCTHGNRFSRLDRQTLQAHT